MYACRCTKDDTCLKLLIGESGKQDESGKTALIFAIEMKNVKAIRILIPLEAIICDIDGNTALMRYV